MIGDKVVDIKSKRETVVTHRRDAGTRESLIAGHAQCPEHPDCIQIMMASFPTKRTTTIQHWDIREWADFVKKTLECCMATERKDVYIDAPPPQPCHECQAEPGTKHAQWCRSAPGAA